MIATSNTWIQFSFVRPVDGCFNEGVVFRGTFDEAKKTAVERLVSDENVCTATVSVSFGVREREEAAYVKPVGAVAS